MAELDPLLEQAYATPLEHLGNQADPLDEAIYIILSFQTDLARFRETWRRLKDAFPTWEALEHAPAAHIVKAIRDGGLQRQKARILKRLLAAVRKLNDELSLDWLRSLSDAEAERVLTSLPGLSWKGARCILLYSLRRASLPVDGNTFRILKRYGILQRNAVYRRKSLHDALQSMVPADRRLPFHVNLVVHGQQTCLPSRPRCSECPVAAGCLFRGRLALARVTVVTPSLTAQQEGAMMTKIELEELRDEFLKHARSNQGLSEGTAKQYWKFFRQAGGGEKPPILYISKPGRAVVHLKNVQPNHPRWTFISGSDPKKVGNLHELRLQGDKEDVRSAFYAGFAKLVNALG